MKYGIVKQNSVMTRQFFKADIPTEVVGVFHHSDLDRDYLCRKQVDIEGTFWAANIRSKLADIKRYSRVHFESFTGKSLEEYYHEYKLYLWVPHRNIQLVPLTPQNKLMKQHLIRLEE